MGNNISLRMFPESHVRIYKNVLSLQAPGTRVQMLQTLLAGPEYIHSFKQAGIYADILQYISRFNAGVHPGYLPGEGGQVQQQPPPQVAHSPAYVLTNHSNSVSNPYERIMKGKSNEKALSYFQTCLQVLGLEEEVALSDEELKRAYKKAAIKAHPDKKGGSEQHFEAVTRAYAYLTEIINRIQGGRQAPLKKVEEPNLLKTERSTEAQAWKQAEPIRLNPNKLDMNAFNKMFEQTRIPEPDEDGYGDWLKTESETNAPKFSGKFNRDVFNSMFEEEAAKQRSTKQNMALTIANPQALVLAPTYGVELGRDKPADYTAPMNADLNLGYTDLRAAYTTANTFSAEVADVRVDARDFGQYQESRKRAPDPLRNEEMEAITAMEKEAEERERRRQIRAADEVLRSDDFHQRMKRLVLTDGVPISRQERR